MSLQLLQLLLTSLLAFLLSLYGTPLAGRAAMKFGIVDAPDGGLKRQREPIPYLGGLAVYLSFLLSLALVFQFDRRILGILLAGSIVVILGLIDDLGALSPKEKLFGQLVACFVLVKSGIVIEIAAFPDPVNLILTYLWVVGVINAINIIDIMDGLSSGVALIAAFFLGVVAQMNHEPMFAMLAAALIGSLLGFLRYNFPPAQIYLGDTGSMFVGLMLAALSITGRYASHNRIAYFAPVLILGIPLFDLFFVSLVRWWKGRSILRGSPDHFAIRLAARGLSPRRVVMLSYSGGLLLGLVALVNLIVGPRESTWLLVAVGLSAVMTMTYLLRAVRK